LWFLPSLMQRAGLIVNPYPASLLRDPSQKKEAGAE
jgi:hypothetical protein